jgi:NADH-quinone oxidoreductase subunit M
MQHVVDYPWFTLPGSGIPIRFHMGVDGLSILMVGLTTYLMPLAVLSTWGHIHKRTKEFMMWMLVLETGMIGVFVSTDLVLFYFFWEISLIPLYFMVGIWGHERRLYAAIKFFLYTFAGSVVMLIAAIVLIYKTQTTDIERLCEMARACRCRCRCGSSAASRSRSRSRCRCCRCTRGWRTCTPRRRPRAPRTWRPCC